MIQKGEKVEWTKDGKKRSGTVIAVVPAGKRPDECINIRELSNASIKPLGLIATLEPRSETSYLIQSEIELPYSKKMKAPERKVQAIFWPLQPVSHAK